MIQASSIQGLQHLQPISTNQPVESKADIIKSFGEFMSEALNNVASQEVDVHKKNDQYLAGQIDATELLIASSQSQLSLQLTSTIRNKAVEAYQEIMRIQI